MTSTELYRSGKLAEAVEAQIHEVKAAPADQGKRLFLFELLAFSGNWDRARRQIDAVQYGDADLDMATQAYRFLVDAEQARRRVLTEGLTPQFLAEPPEHVRLRLEGARNIAAGQHTEAARLLSLADEQAPPIRGRLNDKPIEGLRDCDDLFGSVLEVLAQGNYFWVPFEQINSLTIKPPRFPRDLLWLPARLEASASSGDVFLPVLYPGSAEHADDDVRLGRRTDWSAADGGPVLGVGQRTFLVGEDPLNLLEVRSLERDQAT
jgi:type VI secretion system protein ImpE